jgi:hypothetical protein
MTPPIGRVWWAAPALGAVGLLGVLGLGTGLADGDPLAGALLLALALGALLAGLGVVAWATRAPGRPRVVCAWCGALLRRGPAPTSHGICRRCARAVLEGRR